jgi:hypothetical protein
MSQDNGTGVVYPTIELGGTAYTVRFSRGSLYRMQKLGVAFAPKIQPIPDQPGMIRRTMTFSEVVDVMHIGINFPGTAEQLAELVTNDKVQEAFDKIMEAWGKAFPSPQIRLQESAGQPEANPPVQ